MQVKTVSFVIKLPYMVHGHLLSGESKRKGSPSPSPLKASNTFLQQDGWQPHFYNMGKENNVSNLSIKGYL